MNRSMIGLAALPFALSLGAPASKPAAASESHALPPPLSIAIRRIERASKLRVSTTTELGSVSQGTSVMDYVAPGSEESAPRAITIGAKQFGASITIGLHSWTRYPLPHPYVFVESTNKREQITVKQSLFYPLIIATRATSYRSVRTGWGFSAKTLSGTILMMGGCSAKVTVSFNTELAGHKTREVISAIYDRAAHIAPIVAPPPSVVARSGTVVG